MERSSQTSFIPKKPENAGYAPRGVSIALIISLFLFFVSSLSAAIVFLLEKSIAKENEKNRQELATYQKEDRAYFDTMRDLKRFSGRITEGQKLLENHISVSLVFDTLQNLTLKSIRYKSFEFKIASVGGAMKGGSTATFTVSGEAPGYESIAYQSLVFGEAKGKGISEPVFSNFSIEPNKKTVAFSLSAAVDVGSLNYSRQMLLGGGSSATGTSSGAATSAGGSQAP